MRRAAVGALLLLLAAFGGSAHAEDDYREWYKGQQRIQRHANHRYLHVELRLSSTSKDVKPEAIAMIIQAKAGPIRVPVNAQGTMTWPMSQALYDENPKVISNQPKKTVQATVEIIVEAPPTQQFAGSVYDEMAAEYLAAVKQEGVLVRLLSPSPQGLVLRFPPGSRAVATVRSPGAADQRFDVGADDMIRLPKKRDWHRPGAQVFLSALPRNIALDLGQ